MSTQITFTEETPENYRSPGSRRSPRDIGPSTRELLNLLNSIEDQVAAKTYFLWYSSLIRLNE